MSRPEEYGYRGPSERSAYHSGFFWRRFGAVVGPHPVISFQGRMGFEKRQWFDPSKVERRTFEIFYGFNPRCLRQGTWGKPGHDWEKRVGRFQSTPVPGGAR